MLPYPPLMLITDAAQAALPLDTVIAGALKGGCRWILLRDIQASDKDLMEQALPIQTLCATFQAKLFISRNMVVAKKIGADGIHLSSSADIGEARRILGNETTIGQSCHHETDLLCAEKNGADYITLSPVFESASKPGYGPALGTTHLESLCKKSSVPVVALGGMTPERAAQCMHAGAFGVAVMGDVMRSENPENQVNAYLRYNRWSS